MIAVEDRVVMARPKKVEKTQSIRLSDEAIKWARIASAFTMESVPEYISRICVENGQRDAERLHAEVKKSKGTESTKR